MRRWSSTWRESHWSRPTSDERHLSDFTAHGMTRPLKRCESESRSRGATHADRCQSDGDIRLGLEDRSMRTTVEIDDDKLIKLRKLAAERGERGYSGLIDKALEQYLLEVVPPSDGGEFVDEFQGLWTDEEAEEVRARIAESRKHWR